MPFTKYYAEQYSVSITDLNQPLILSCKKARNNDPQVCFPVLDIPMCVLNVNVKSCVFLILKVICIPNLLGSRCSRFFSARTLFHYGTHGRHDFQLSRHA